MCPAVRKYKVFLLADTLICYLVTLFHSARLVYRNDMKDFLRVVNLGNKRHYEFYDPMTVHRNRFLVNKANRCTEFQFYWYYYSTCFGQPFCPSSGVLSCTSALAHFMQF